MTKAFILVALTVIFIGVFFQPKIGGISETTAINDLISRVQTDLQPNGNYKHIPFFKCTDEIDCQVNEYVTPKGEKGNWILLRKEVQVSQFNATTSKNELVNKTLIKSIGYGVQASDYTYDWR